MINSIQTGPYRNIYNPENFFIGQSGLGAGNNWAAGYAAGDQVQEEIFDMIDREADGSDSLEVCPRTRHKHFHPLLLLIGYNRVLCYFIPLLVGQALD